MTADYHAPSKCDYRMTDLRPTARSTFAIRDDRFT